MKILYVASEAQPFCKTGGLADVAGSLPQALAAEGHDTAVIVPLYRAISQEWRAQMTFERYIYVDLGWRHQYCGLFSLERQGVTWYFVDNKQYFDRDKLYGDFDDGERFAFFSRSVVALLPLLHTMPEVVICNDWQTALVPIYLKDLSAREEWPRPIRTVFTIHNIEYQGRYGKETVEEVFALNANWFNDGTLAMDGDVNLLKGAMMIADAVVTVSPTYARELRHPFYAHGMQSVVALLGDKMHGILNGIDVKDYHPWFDRALSARYSARHPEGKSACKASLQQELGLAVEADTPLIAMVSRLVAHKGLDLVCSVLDDLMATGAQLAVLGQGDRAYEDFFRYAQGKYPGQVVAWIGYNGELSRRFYAGADLFLMPSKSEPCGLSQMIAMRYGTVPIVRETGGLKDTVQPYQAWNGEGNGFTFANYDAFDMRYVIEKAVELYREEPEAFRALQVRDMQADFSWRKSALAYAELCASLL
jgi:starch synthase